MPEGSGADEQDCRGGDPPWAVPLRYPVKGGEAALGIFRRVGVRDVYFPFLVRLVLIAFIEELPGERVIMRLIAVNPLGSLDPLCALDRSRMARP